jgi:hypothetical protein
MSLSLKLHSKKMKSYNKKIIRSINMDKFIEITNNYKKNQDKLKLDKTDQFKPTPKKVIWHFDDNDSVGVKDETMDNLDVVNVDDPNYENPFYHDDYGKSSAQIFLEDEEARYFDNHEYYSDEEEEEEEGNYETDYETDYDSEDDEYYNTYEPVKNKDGED